MLKDPRPSISVILPTFNEKDGIAALIHCIEDELAGLDYEIIVVDDNSPDGTFHVVKTLGLMRVRACVNRARIGLARSVYAGIKKSRADTIVVMDSDFNHQPKYLKFMLHALECCDCISASRFLRTRSIHNPWRRLLTYLFNTFTRVMLGGGLTDYFYGYFAIQRACLNRLALDRIFYGYGDYYMRLLFEMEKRQMHVMEFSAVNGRRYAGEGNKNPVGVFVRYLTEVVKYAYQFRFQNGPQRN